MSSEKNEGRIVRRDEGSINPVEETAPRKKHEEPVEESEPRRRGCWGTCALFGGMSLLVMTLVLALLIVAMVVDLADFLGDPVDNFLAVFGIEKDSTPVEVDSRTIVLGIQDLAVLQTVSSDIQITKQVVDTGAAPDAELRMTYIGEVTAGIDLSAITEADVVINPDGSTMITLPPTQITGCSLRNPQIERSSCTDIPLGVQDCDSVLKRLQEEAYDRATEELLETATELDLLDLAQANAETAVYGLLQNFGYEQVQFQHSDAVLPPDDSCIP